MKWFKTGLAVFVGGLTMWLLAGLWHLVIVPEFYAKGIHASHHEGGVLILVAYVLLAILMAGVYRSYIHRGEYRIGKSALEGLKLGLLMGLLWVTPHALVRAGAHGGSLPYILVNGLWHLVEQGTGGVIMGLVFGLDLGATRKKTLAGVNPATSA
ncbi:MAG: hypothetical protein ACYTHM_07010 [Planctomycetota bacterium]|jgi:hypothetical protein